MSFIYLCCVTLTELQFVFYLANLRKISGCVYTSFEAFNFETDIMRTPRKKSEKKAKKKKTNENDVMHNVDKTFYELQITDLNRKLARLKSKVQDLEETNISLETKLGKMDEDRGDIICYLKRNVTERNTEVADLQLKVVNLTEQNTIQQEKHEAQMEECREEYNTMREQLIAKNKHLLGQLNALEDYRAHREELLQKFDEVQKELDAQELKFKKHIYEMEKKAVIDRAHLKREMEEKMFNLANKFQEANQVRIAATSQRIVRENIAINNEMNNLINSTNELDCENLLIRQQFKKVLADYQLLEQEHKQTIREFGLQTGVIWELTDINLKQKEIIDKYEISQQRSIEDNRKHQDLLVNVDILKNNIKTLESKVNAARYAERDLQTQLAAENNFRHHLEIMVNDVRLLIKSTLHEHPELHKKVEIPRGGNILDNILNMLTYTIMDILPPSPVATISSVSLRQTSDLGASQTQRIVEMKPPIKTYNVATYLGASFQDFCTQHEIKSVSISTVSPESTSSKEFAFSASEDTVSSSSSDEESSESNVRGTLRVLDGGTIQSSEYVYDEVDEEEEEEEEKMDEEKLVE